MTNYWGINVLQDVIPEQLAHPDIFKKLKQSLH